MRPEQQLARLVKQHRAWRRLSQRELAELAGINRQTIASIEAGRANPSLRLVARLADALQADLMLSLRPQHPGRPRLQSPVAAQQP